MQKRTQTRCLIVQPGERNERKMISINNLTVSFVWEYVLSFELVRFLVGSIGLVLAVPISQLVLKLWTNRRKGAQHG